MREIHSLVTMSLRAVGPKTCDPEITFGGPRRVVKKDKKKDDTTCDDDDDDDVSITCPSPPPEPTLASRLLRSLRDNTTLPQKAYSGAGRPSAADVDLSHPWVLAAYPPRTSNLNAPLDTTDNGGSEILTIENGNHAVECLQQFIDALVESGQTGDTRLGVHFFREWVVAVIGEEAAKQLLEKGEGSSIDPPNKKRRRNVGEYCHLQLGSLSLHNLSLASIRTFKSMEMANVGMCLGTLDLTGAHGLTDSILTNVICGGSFPRIKRLSIKNCRKVTGKGLASLSKLTELTALDVGGCFNIHPNDVVLMIQNHPGTKMGKLNEIYAGGLNWTDVALESIIEETAGHLRGLGVGFSPYISGPMLILTLKRAASTLDRLSVPFCEGMDDAAASSLGRSLPKLAVLDVRGCSKISSLTGLMDGRGAAGGGAAAHLFVLARYSGISRTSLEDTMRLHPGSLTCVLDGGGIGEGIRR
eukprot:g495.t1 g495   contig10:158408-159820(+)